MLAFATHSAPVRIGKWELSAYNLADGRRILEKSAFKQVLAVDPSSSGSKILQTLLKHPLLRTNRLASRLGAFSDPIRFKDTKNKLTGGFEAEALVDVCKFLLKAREVGALRTLAELRHAQAAEELIVSLANVGIIAIIDEATGYQAERKKGALQEILDKFLRADYDSWNKRFPDDFYQEIYRLRGWEWKGRSQNPPQCVAQFTNFMIYTRLAPGILPELESRNPILESGARLVKHHQWLSDDVGRPTLSHHIFAVVTLMKISSTWTAFVAKLVRAFPQYGDQTWLELEE